MTRLSSEQLLKDDNSTDPNSISSLQLNHKALSDVSCLGIFKNLEKLDLKLNNLTSLEGLRSCVNLKWLSVVENKLESLEGIQGLTKLTVLNAGKNKLESMDEVRSLVSLRALILNENEIVSICKLDQMKDLNTLVLSKNPIRKIGDALVKVKSITKLSLSHCQLQTFDSSLKSCVELKELRLAHNEIKNLPADLVHNSKLQNLDLGNNVITGWSDLKVLKSLVNLRNLNLQGNPVATNDKIARKIRKALPKLQIFNARPVDEQTKNEKGDRVDELHDFPIAYEGQNEGYGTEEKKNAKNHPMGQNENDPLETAGYPDLDSKSSKKRKKTVDVVSKKKDKILNDDHTAENKYAEFKNPVKDKKKSSDLDTLDFDVENKSHKKKLRKDDKLADKGLVLEENATKVKKKLKKKPKNEKLSEVDVIDDADASFMDILNVKDAENLEHDNVVKVHNKVPKGVSSVDTTVTSLAKRKSTRRKNMEPPLSSLEEVGMGGPSTWGDE